MTLIKLKFIYLLYHGLSHSIILCFQIDGACAFETQFEQLLQSPRLLDCMCRLLYMGISKETFVSFCCLHITCLKLKVSKETKLVSVRNIW